MAGTSRKQSAGPRRPQAGKSAAQRQRGRPSQAAVAAPAGEAAVQAAAPAAVPQRSRRRPAAVSTAVAPLPRDVEMAYIYADLRRLVVIAGALLALMLVILFIVER